MTERLFPRPKLRRRVRWSRAYKTRRTSGTGGPGVWYTRPPCRSRAMHARTNVWFPVGKL